MKLWQYWDSEKRPQQIDDWLKDMGNINPELDHVILDHTSASDFIKENFGEREFEAFQACAVPAMQADYLRLCLMYALGGLYVDADHQPATPVRGMLAEAPVALIPQWLTIVHNGILFFRRAGNLYMKACLELATDNIINRRFENVLISTGPGLLNAVRYMLDPPARPGIDFAASHNWLEVGWRELLAAADEIITPRADILSDYRSITFMDSDRTLQWLKIEPPNYKEGENHWLNWKGSIYR